MLPRPDDKKPASRGSVRKVRFELSALRSDLFMELNTRLDNIGEFQDKQEDSINRLRRSVKRLEARVKELELMEFGTEGEE